MPKKEKIVVKLPDGTMAKELISMYDERNIIDFDKIDVKGLAPYDYRRFLDEHNTKGITQLKIKTILYSSNFLLPLTFQRKTRHQSRSAASFNLE